MSDFKAKMHQIRRSLDPLAGFEGLLLREGREGKGKGMRGEGRGGRRREGRGGLSGNVAEEAFCLKS